MIAGLNTKMRKGTLMTYKLLVQHVRNEDFLALPAFLYFIVPDFLLVQSFMHKALHFNSPTVPLLLILHQIALIG